MCSVLLPLLKGKAQYSWPPCTNKFRTDTFDNANIIYFSTKQATLMRRSTVLSLPLQKEFLVCDYALQLCQDWPPWVMLPKYMILFVSHSPRCQGKYSSQLPHNFLDSNYIFLKPNPFFTLSTLTLVKFKSMNDNMGIGVQRTFLWTTSKVIGFIQSLGS